MKRILLSSVACMGAVLLAGIYLQPRETATEGTIQVIPGAQAIPGGMRSSDPAIPQTHAPFPLASGATAPGADFLLLETEAAGEDDRGAAVIQRGGGPIQHVAVDDWVDGTYRLTAVSDTDATLTDGLHVLTLEIEPSPPIASNPAGGLPGTDFNQPGKANPAMARR